MADAFPISGQHRPQGVPLPPRGPPPPRGHRLPEGRRTVVPEGPLLPRRPRPLRLVERPARPAGRDPHRERQDHAGAARGRQREGRAGQPARQGAGRHRLREPARARRGGAGQGRAHPLRRARLRHRQLRVRGRRAAQGRRRPQALDREAGAGRGAAHHRPQLRAAPPRGPRRRASPRRRGLAAACPSCETDAGDLLEQLDGSATLKEAAARTRLDEFEAAKIACALLFLGLVKRVERRTPPWCRARRRPAAFEISDSDGPELDLTATVHAAFKAREPEPAAADGGAASAGAAAPPAAAAGDPVRTPRAASVAAAGAAVGSASAREPALTLPDAAGAAAAADRDADPGARRPALQHAARRATGRTGCRSCPRPPSTARPRVPSARPSKDDLAAVDALLNSRTVEGPMAAFEKSDRSVDRWTPEFGVRAPMSPHGPRSAEPRAAARRRRARRGRGRRGGRVVLPARGARHEVADGDDARGQPARPVADGRERGTGSADGATARPRPPSPPHSPRPFRRSRPRRRPRPRPPDPSAWCRPARSCGKASSRRRRAGSRRTRRSRPAARCSVQLLVACAPETVQKAVAAVDSPELYILPVELPGPGLLPALLGHLPDAGPRDRRGCAPCRRLLPRGRRVARGSSPRDRCPCCREAASLRLPTVLAFACLRAAAAGRHHHADQRPRDRGRPAVVRRRPAPLREERRRVRPAAEPGADRRAEAARRGRRRSRRRARARSASPPRDPVRGDAAAARGPRPRSATRCRRCTRWRRPTWRSATRAPRGDGASGPLRSTTRDPRARAPAGRRARRPGRPRGRRAGVPRAACSLQPDPAVERKLDEWRRRPRPRRRSAARSSACATTAASTSRWAPPCSRRSARPTPSTRGGSASGRTSRSRSCSRRSRLPGRARARVGRGRQRRHHPRARARPRRGPTRACSRVLRHELAHSFIAARTRRQLPDLAAGGHRRSGSRAATPTREDAVRGRRRAPGPLLPAADAGGAVPVPAARRSPARLRGEPVRGRAHHAQARRGRASCACSPRSATGFPPRRRCPSRWPSAIPSSRRAGRTTLRRRPSRGRP